MDTLSREELEILINKRNERCISIFMPTYRTGVEIQQNQIRLRNLLREAEEKLLVSGLRTTEVKSLLEPIQGLLGNILFWRRQSDGLAIFLSSDMFRFYCLPLDFGELVIITDRFHIKPLLPALRGDERFYILALSQNEVRLLEGTRHSVREIDLETIPKSLAKALQYDVPGKEVRFHPAISGSGGRSVMVSGHGASMEDVKDNILKYFRQIDRGLRDLLRDEQAPLVLAGVNYLFPIYREANTYPRLMEEGTGGNPKGMGAEQLHTQAWSIVEPCFQKAEAEAIAQYRQSLGTGLTSNDIIEIVQAACHGRIGLLFVAIGHRQWGVVDPNTYEVHLHEKMEPGDEDLFDFAAIKTFLNGATVFALPPERIPDGASVAAVFRY
ncbi:MAG: hypothetical protein QMD03_05395 [Syntrophales bacterium]|nr:hypothetical protein [Syntrophales bacterium]